MTACETPHHTIALVPSCHRSNRPDRLCSCCASRAGQTQLFQSAAAVQPHQGCPWLWAAVQKQGPAATQTAHWPTVRLLVFITGSQEHSDKVLGFFLLKQTLQTNFPMRAENRVWHLRTCWVPLSQPGVDGGEIIWDSLPPHYFLTVSVIPCHSPLPNSFPIKIPIGEIGT